MVVGEVLRVMLRPSLEAPRLFRCALRVFGLLVALSLAIACDGAESCPGKPCDPRSNGDPFDLIDWCRESGECLQDGARVCEDADAHAAPCALGSVDASVTLTFPVGTLSPALGGRQDLVVVTASCDTDAEPPDFKAVQVRFDGEPAQCTSLNPCDPAGTPTVTTCLGVPRTVQSISLSFTYDGREGPASVQASMQDTTCSYFCS